MKTQLLLGCTLTLAVLTGCKDDPAPTPPGPTPPATTQPASKPDEHANAVPLGEKTVDGIKFVATQDEPVKPGGEGAFDLTITGTKPKAVRFWVGLESAQGSRKAKADEEKPGTWHTHADVPNPLPEGSKFWAEVEPETGETVKVSFDLK